MSATATATAVRDCGAGTADGAVVGTGLLGLRGSVGSPLVAVEGAPGSGGDVRAGDVGPVVDADGVDGDVGTDGVVRLLAGGGVSGAPGTGAMGPAKYRGAVMRAVTAHATPNPVAVRGMRRRGCAADLRTAAGRRGQVVGGGAGPSRGVVGPGSRAVRAVVEACGEGGMGRATGLSIVLQP